MVFLRKYNTATHIYVPIIKRGVIDFAVSADWTPSAGDVKISLDGAAAANVTNLPTAITMGNTAMWDFSLTAGELQAAKVLISVSDSATKAVEDQFIIIETFGNASAQFQVDLSDSVRFGLTALPNAAAAANGGLATVDASNAVKVQSGTGANQISLSSGLVTLAATGLDNVVCAEPGGVPALTANLKTAVSWLLALARNKITQTSTTQTLRNDADSGNIATAAVSDDGTTFTRAEWA